MIGRRPKRHRKLQRWQKHDYSYPGWYFVTICTKYMVEWFGDVVNGEMELNDCGKIAQQYWLDIPKHYQHIRIDEFVIMPNHVHGIIVIERNRHNVVGTEHCSVPTMMDSRYGSLSKVVMSYKNLVTKKIRMHQSKFQWQRSFYDHIIRTPIALYNIQRYIKNNLANW